MPDIQIIAPAEGENPRIHAEEHEVLPKFPGRFDGNRFYWDHIGPSARDLLQIRRDASKNGLDVEMHLDISLSPNPFDVYVQLTAASRHWDFWPEEMLIGEHQPAGEAIREALPDEKRRPRSEAHISLAKKIVTTLVEDGVDLESDVDYDPSLTPRQVRHVRGMVASRDQVSKLAEEPQQDPQRPIKEDIGYIQSKFDVSEAEVRDALQGEGPYQEIEGQYTMMA